METVLLLAGFAYALGVGFVAARGMDAFAEKNLPPRGTGREGVRTTGEERQVP